MLEWQLYVTVFSHLPPLSTLTTGSREVRKRPILHFFEPMSSICHHVFIAPKFVTEVNPYLTDHLVSQSQRHPTPSLGKAWAVILFWSNGYSLAPSSQINPQPSLPHYLSQQERKNGISFIPHLLCSQHCARTVDTYQRLRNTFKMPLCESRIHRKPNKNYLGWQRR